MSKKKGKFPGMLREQARKKLVDLGYDRMEEDYRLYDPLGDGSIETTAELAVFDENEPVIFFASAGTGDASRTFIQEDAKFKAALGADKGKPFPFVWLWDGSNDFIFDLQKDAQISELPVKNRWRAVVRPLTDSRTRLLQDLSTEYHRGDYRSIQKKFDLLHEAIYSRGGVKPTNAAIDELGKLLFLKIHIEKEPNYVLKTGKAEGKPFSEIYSRKYISGEKLREKIKDTHQKKEDLEKEIEKHKKQAVIELKDAFREINNLPQYKATDITGEEHSIFAYDEPLRLENPDVLAMAIDSLNLHDLNDNPIRLFIPDRELVGSGEQAQKMRNHLIHEDLLSWAFGVFKRQKYASDEGLATYLTPGEVVECMVRMAFHDISDAELWARRGEKNQKERWNPAPGQEDLPAFLCGDICCGTGTFLITALRFMKMRIFDHKHVGHSDEDKIAWLAKMKRYSIFGADQASGSIQKARINMLLYGEDHSQLLKVDDSIADPNIDKLIGKFDLLLTNPPFGSGKYDDPRGLAKMRQEKEGLELGWKWKAGDRSKRSELTKADPAALFIDRNLQLLKPGGRLLILVPDGILCNSGDAHIREYIMGIKDEETGEFLGGKAILKAVVSLPTATFSISGTGAKTSFLYLQKKRYPAEKQDPVFMAVADHVGYMKKGKSEIPDPKGNDLVEIANNYNQTERGIK